MKKILLSVAVLSAVAGANAKSLDGWYASAGAGYSWYKATIKHLDEGNKFKFSVHGASLLASVGYGETSMNNFYIGGDARVGYNFGSDKTTVHGESGKLSRAWLAGAAVRLGGYANQDCLIYGRLGVDYDSASQKIGSDKKGSMTSWSIVPGVGLNYKVSHCVFLTAELDYKQAFQASVTSGKKVSSKPYATTILVGVGMTF